MNFAKVIQIEGKPTLVIYAHAGGHQHTDTIDGVTLDGECISRRYPTEEMPKGDEIQPWLVNRTQDVLGAAERENRESIKRLRDCMANDRWPTGYESLRTFDWM